MVRSIIKKRNIFSNFQKGFSLAEILIATAILLIFVTVFSTTIINIKNQLSNSLNKERAVALADEGLEVVRNLRDQNFNNLTDGTYGLDTSGNQFNLSGISDTTGIFNRSLTISTIYGEQKKVNAVVSWADRISANNSVSFDTYLTNWRAVLNVGLTMDKVVINHGGTKTPADFLPYDLNTFRWDNTVDPPVLQNINIPIIFSPSTMNLIPGTYTFSTTNDPNYPVTLSVGCNSGSITLISGDAKLCSITYEENVSVATLSTTAISNITENTADSGGNITSDGGSAVTARGVAWSTSPNPTIALMTKTSDGIGTGSFVSNLTGLTPGTLYYVRAYVTNGAGTAYGNELSFTTNTPANVVPTVTSPTATSISSTTATLGANVTSLGFPASISARGTCYGTSPAPTTNCVAEGGTTTGVFTQARTGLIPGTLYYYRGYATNATGTGYSADGTFTTIAACTSALIGTPTVYNSASSASAVVNKPTGVAQGDIMFAHILHSNSADRLTTIPAGWVSIGRHRSGSNNQALYYKVAGASEGVNYTFGLSQSSKLAVTISVYRGCFDTTNPIDVSSNVEYVVNNTTYRAASMNLSSAYTNVLMFPSMSTTTVRTFANPLTQGGGWTEDYDHGATTSDFSRAGYRKLINVSGATGVIDSIGTAGTVVKHAFAVALKPI